MNRTTTAVLLLNTTSSPDLAAALQKAGFGRVQCQGASTVRVALQTLLAERNVDAIVTVNPKEEFTIADIERTADVLYKFPTELCAALPDEPQKQNMPERLYSFLSGISPAAAQTSLFAMSAKTAKILTKMKSSEDTFLSNIPLEARIYGIELHEVKTDVDAPEPDFHLLTRSFKLYYVFIKFSIAAMIAYVVDIGTFWIFEVMFGFLDDEYKILVATVLSRILCSITTYILNRSAVFRSESRQQSSIPRFVILSVAQLLASWLLVWGLGVLFNANDVGNMLLKVVVDLVIFIASFTIMRDWVFKKTEPSGN